MKNNIISKKRKSITQLCKYWKLVDISNFNPRITFLPESLQLSRSDKGFDIEAFSEEVDLKVPWTVDAIMFLLECHL